MTIKFNLNSDNVLKELTVENTPLVIPIVLRRKDRIDGNKDTIAIRIMEGVDDRFYQFVTFFEGDVSVSRTHFISLKQNYYFLRPLGRDESFSIPGVA